MAEEKATDQDLSAGSPSDHQLQIMQLERDEAKQRIFHQHLAFGSAVLFVAALTGVFIYFILKMLCLLETTSGLMDWHILLLGSGLIVPATLIMYALIKRNNAGKPCKKDDEELPSTGLLKEVAEMLKEILGLVSSSSKKATD